MVSFSTVKNVLAMPSVIFELTSHRYFSIFLIKGHAKWPAELSCLDILTDGFAIFLHQLFEPFSHGFYAAFASIENHSQNRLSTFHR